MGKSRLELDEILRGLAPHVYYQPPTNIRMEFPCIIYEKSNGYSGPADNMSYIYVKSYQITVVDKDPDSLIPDKVAALPFCTLQRHYVYDNLNHDVFDIYF